MQTLIALMIVVLAAFYAGWKFLPKGLRGSLASKAASWAQASGKLSEDNVRRLESKLASGGACGSCDSCKACGTNTDKSLNPTSVPNPVPNLTQKENRAAFMGIPIIKSR